MKKLKTSESILETVQLKKTKARVVLLDFLLDEHGPFTIEQLAKEKTLRNMDLVTIYRCLASFEKAGIARRCDFGDGIARFEFEDPSEHHHHHVICIQCKKAENINECEMKPLEKLVQKMGYSQIRHSLEFFGLCRHCQVE